MDRAGRADRGDRDRRAPVGSGDDDGLADADVCAGEGVILWFNLDGTIDDYYARVREASEASGATLTQELIDYPWGDRAFTLRDPFGYTLTFSNYTQTAETPAV